MFSPEAQFVVKEVTPSDVDAIDLAFAVENTSDGMDLAVESSASSAPVATKKLSPPKRIMMKRGTPSPKPSLKIGRTPSPVVPSSSSGSGGKKSGSPTGKSSPYLTKMHVPSPKKLAKKSPSPKKPSPKKPSPIRRPNTAAQPVSRKASFLQPTASSKSHKTDKVGKANADGLRSKSVGDVPGFKVPSQWKPGKLTKPVGPKMRIEQRLRVSSSQTKVLSSEEREFFEVEAARLAEEKRMRRDRKAVERMKFSVANPLHTVVRSTKELTVPVTPVSRLSSRLGPKFAANPKADEVGSPQRTKTDMATEGLTVPKPFSFAIEKRIPVEEHKPKDTPSDAQLMEDFTKNTRSSDAPADPTRRGPTVPRAPVFHPLTARVLPKSTAEREEELMAEFQKNTFKAKPVNPMVFESNGELGVPQVRARKATEPVDIHFKSDERIEARKKAASPIKSGNVEGHSSPGKSPQKNESPRKRLKKKKKKIMAPYMTGRPTAPLSPKFSGGRSASAAHPARQKPPHREVEAAKRAKEREILAAVMKKRQAAPTVPKPFALRTDTRHVSYEIAREQQAAVEALKNAQGFRANPVPSFKNPFQVEPSDKPLTEAEPFALKSEKRHEASVLKARNQLDEMIKNAKQAQSFHARPLTDEVIYGAPTSAPKPVLELTQPEEIRFRSEMRAEERRRFDENAMQARQRVEELEAARRAQQEEADNLELKKLRRTSFEEGGFNFIAKAILEEDPHPLPTGHEPLPLTNPRSPMLLTKQRALMSERGTN